LQVEIVYGAAPIVVGRHMKQERKSKKPYDNAKTITIPRE